MENRTEKGKETITSLEDVFPHISEKEQGYILGYAQASLDRAGERREEKEPA